MGKSKDKVVKDDSDDSQSGESRVESEVSPIAKPLADPKLEKKVLKVVKKAFKAKRAARGLKQVEKLFKKKTMGLLVIAADVWPMDSMAHLPVLAEDAGVPYVFVRQQTVLGEACLTKDRATMAVMVLEPGKDDEYKSKYAELVDSVNADVAAKYGGGK
jgi:H/ACA ribonucleoprotein complex subunit 2